MQGACALKDRLRPGFENAPGKGAGRRRSGPLHGRIYACPAGGQDGSERAMEELDITPVVQVFPLF